MPRHIQKPDAALRADHLKERLVSELRTPSLTGQPIIREDRTPQTNSIRAYVIWDDWQSVPGDLRTDSITQAYREALGEEISQQLRLALGNTVAEAIDIGLLPFKVLTARKRDESLAREQYEAVMRAFGAGEFNGEGL